MQLEFLKNVCLLTMGQAPPGSSYNEVQEGFPLIAGAGDFGETTPRPKRHTISASRISQPEDIILCIRATIGDLNWSDKQYCLGRGVAGLRPKTDKLDKDYLWHWLQTVKPELLKQAKGSTFKQIDKKTIQELQIPLPPLEEQRRIAAILDKADGVRRKRKAAIALTEDLLRSTFLDMFGDPVTNPKSWEISKVIDYCDCIVPGRDKPKSFTGKIPWVTTADLNHLGYTYKSSSSIGLTTDEIKQVNARIIPANSVLLTCVGDLGVVSIAAQDMVINQQLHAFQCKDISNLFLMYTLTYQKNFMYQMSTQTTVPYMNKTTCNSIPIIYPPLILQEKFERIYRKILSFQAMLRNVLEESENLFNSLLQRAFRGDL